MNINDTFKKPSSIYTKYTKKAIVAEAGAPFTLNFSQKSSGRTQTAWAADVYVDFNADKEFVSEGEYIGRIQGVKNGSLFDFSTEITIPEGTNVSTCAIRIKMNNAADAPSEPEFASCADVYNGMVLNLPLEVSKYVERPIIS